MSTVKEFLVKQANVAGMGRRGINAAMDFTTPSVISGNTISRPIKSISKKVGGNNKARLISGSINGKAKGKLVNPSTKKQSVADQLKEKARLSSYSGTGMSKGRQNINNSLGKLFGMKNHAVL